MLVNMNSTSYIFNLENIFDFDIYKRKCASLFVAIVFVFGGKEERKMVLKHEGKDLLKLTLLLLSKGQN